MSNETIQCVEGKNDISRRGFLGRVGGGLVLGVFLPGLSRLSEADAAVPGTQVNAWLQIGLDESITLTVGSSEMGQGSFSGLAQILAEELMVDYSRVVTAQGGPTIATPAPVGTAINTVGSSVTRANFWKLRDAGASARETLVLAMMNFMADLTRGNYTIANGIITHIPSNITRTYGQLAAAAALLLPVTGAALLPDIQFKLIGKTQPRFDIPFKVDGSAKYGIDIRLPNMVYGVVKHSPALGGTLATAIPKISAVVGRLIFYNNSHFDGNDPASTVADDGAIATNKSALLPGQTATFANYTSYEKGINGVMIDILTLPAGVTLTASDFNCLAGNTADPTTWTTSITPASITTRLAAGAGLSDRVTLIFTDRSILNQWLRITVKANANTALPADDVFYFGNLVGGTGQHNNVAIVNTTDIAITKLAINTTVDITSIADFNRNGMVTVTDVAIAKTSNRNSIPFFTAPLPPASAPSAVLAVIPTKVAASTARGLEAVGNVNAVVVVGTNTWDTWQAADRLSLSWNAPANAAALNSAQFIADGQALAASANPYLAGAANPPGTLYTVEGNAAVANAAIATAPNIVDATYILPYVAHATMEVLNCTVDYVAGVKCDVYAPTQSAKGALTLVMAITGMSANQVTIHTTYLGGGLGRKAEVDFISQAVQAAMVIRRPIKLMWPREEDFTHDQYRPMAVMHARAGTDASGAVAGWTYRNISPSILAQRGLVLGPKGDSQGSEGSQALPYNFGARAVEYVTHPSPVPVGFWRSVGASLNTFGVECMIDELATAAGIDPYTFRRNLLTDPRWIAVLDAAATLGGWNTPLPAGHARGIAIGTAFNSIVAEVVEVSAATATSIRVNQVSVAIDCYLVVNPGQVETQLIGGVVHGLNAALYGRQTFVNGAAQSKNFNNSRMIRLGEMPQVNVTMIPSPTVADRTKNIGGVGELGVPTLAPALANAYFKLTGTRVRSLPLFPNATMGGL